jgi:hypothetical protein
MENTGKSWDIYDIYIHMCIHIYIYTYIYIYVYVGNPLAIEVSSWEIKMEHRLFSANHLKMHHFSQLIPSPYY